MMVAYRIGYGEQGRQMTEGVMVVRGVERDIKSYVMVAVG